MSIGTNLEFIMKTFAYSLAAAVLLAAIADAASVAPQNSAADNPERIFAAPQELTVTFPAASKDWDLITIDHSPTVEVKGTLENTSDKTLTIIATGPNPLALTPSGKELAPGTKESITVLVVPAFGAYPIAVSLGALYSVAGEQPLRFATARARLAPADAVAASVDRIMWRGEESDERRVAIRFPQGVTLRDVQVRGAFSARIENGDVFVKPLPPKASEVAQGPVAKIVLPESVRMTGNQGDGRPALATGSIALVVDPEPKYHLAPISLIAQPMVRIIAETQGTPQPPPAK